MKDFTYKNSYNKKVKTDVDVQKTLLKFNKHLSYHETLNYTPVCYDASSSDIGIIRACTGGTIPHLSVQVVNSSINMDSSNDFGDWNEFLVNNSYTYPIAYSGNLITSPAVYGRDIYFQSPSYTVYKITLDSSGQIATTPVVIYNTTELVSIAPVSSSDVYIMKYGDGYSKRIIYISTADIWKGAIYTHDETITTPSDIGSFDAIRVGETDYIITTDATGLRGIFIKHKGTVWSEYKSIIPIDVVDEGSYFKPHLVDNINNNIVLTGELTRPNGKPLMCYSFGPEFWSLSRDMYIGKDIPVGKTKIHLVNDKVWCLGYNFLSISDANKTIGYNQDVEIVSASSVNLSLSSDGTSKLNMNIYDPDNSVKPGVDVIPTVTVNDTEYQMGVFDIDGIVTTQTSSGVIKQVTARGKGLKRLSQWFPDSSYEYRSQNKHYSKVSDLAKMVRQSGSWLTDEKDTDTEHLYINNNSFEGAIYPVDRASRNSLIKVSFAKTGTMQFRSQWGVGVNFYEETVVDAAKRLNKEVTAIGNYNRKISGVVALYSAKEYNDQEGIGIYYLENGILEHTIYSCPIIIPVNQKFWFMMKWIDGNISVYYRLDSSYTWIAILENSVYNHTNGPYYLNSDPLGRGFIYVNRRGEAPNSTLKYALTDTNTKIYVDNISRFPGKDPLDDSAFVYGVIKVTNADNTFEFIKYTDKKTETITEEVSGGWVIKLPPQAPINVTATSVNLTTIRLEWSAPGSNTCKIYRKISSENVYTYIADTPNQYYVDSNLSSGTIYYYIVSAVNSYGESRASSIASTNTVYAVPDGKPTLVGTLYDNFQVNVRLYLTDCSTNEDGFEIYKQTIDSNLQIVWIKIHTSTTTSMGEVGGVYTHDDNNLSPNSSYVYFPRAYNSQGYTDGDQITVITGIPESPSRLRTCDFISMNSSVPTTTGISYYLRYQTGLKPHGIAIKQMVLLPGRNPSQGSSWWNSSMVYYRDTSHVATGATSGTVYDGIRMDRVKPNIPNVTFNGIVVVDVIYTYFQWEQNGTIYLSRPYIMPYFSPPNLSGLKYIGDGIHYVYWKHTSVTNVPFCLGIIDANVNVRSDAKPPEIYVSRNGGSYDKEELNLEVSNRPEWTYLYSDWDAQNVDTSYKIIKYFYCDYAIKCLMDIYKTSWQITDEEAAFYQFVHTPWAARTLVKS